MARTRNQQENLSKEELIDELISVEDISSKLSDLTSRYDDFLRQYEILNSELTVSKNCNRLLMKELFSWRGMLLAMLNIIAVNHWR